MKIFNVFGRTKILGQVARNGKAVGPEGPYVRGVWVLGGRCKRAVT